MTEVRKPRITERLWVKVMAILMMCALLAGIVIQGRHIIIMDEYDILTDSENWYESDRCDRMMRIEAVNIMQG